MDITDQKLEDVSPVLARSLLNSKDITLITTKENQSKTMILSIPHRNIWECPTDYKIGQLNQNVPQNYGLLEGVLHTKTDYLKPMENIFIEVTARYFFEKADLDQMDVNVKRYEYYDFIQLHPPPWPEPDPDEGPSFSMLTKKIITKYGPHCFPFQFDLRGGPDSIRYYEHDDSFSKNGVTWTLKAYVSTELQDPLPRDAIAIKFRKLSYLRDLKEMGIASEATSERRISSCCRDGGRVELKAMLDSQVYYHGDTIPVTVVLNNLSDRVITSLAVSIEQIQKITSWTNKTIRQKVSEITITGENFIFPLIPGKKWNEVVNIKIGTVLSKQFSNLLVEYPPEPVSGWRECCLASSTIMNLQDPYRRTKNNNIQPGITNVQYSKPTLLISYEVVVKCFIKKDDGLHVPDISVNIAFVLAHARPQTLRAGLKDAKLID